MKKEFRKAEREYRFFLRIANDDKTLSKEKRRELTLIAENKLEEFKLMRKTDRARYKGRLNLIELNILLLAITVCVLFFLRAITFLHCFVRDQIRARRESKIWLDRYWESRKEKTVSRFSFGVSRAIVYAIVFVVLFYAGRLISIYGLRECFISLWHAFTSLF